jgi:AraC family transcriptional regulator
MAYVKPQAFTAAQTHGRALRSENRLIAHSEGAGWRDLYAARFVEAPFETTEIALEHPSFIYHVTRPTEVIRRIQGQSRERELIGPRRITLTPGGTTAHWHHAGHPEILHVYLRQQLFDSVAAEMYDCEAGRIALRPRFAMQDPLLEELAITINDTMGRDGPARRFSPTRLPGWSLPSWRARIRRVRVRCGGRHPMACRIGGCAALPI